MKYLFPPWKKYKYEAIVYGLTEGSFTLVLPCLPMQMYRVNVLIAGLKVGPDLIAGLKVGPDSKTDVRDVSCWLTFSKLVLVLKRKVVLEMVLKRQIVLKMDLESRIVLKMVFEKKRCFEDGVECMYGARVLSLKS